jgi:hypothetical protein
MTQFDQISPDLPVFVSLVCLTPYGSVTQLSKLLSVLVQLLIFGDASISSLALSDLVLNRIFGA